MYASAMRLASEVMEGDRIKIGENGLLYCVAGIAHVSEGKDKAVVFKLHHELDASQKIVAILAIEPHASLKVYNQ